MLCEKTRSCRQCLASLNLVSITIRQNEGLTVIDKVKRVTEATVRSAINELKTAGMRVSVRALRQRIGYGSMSTIARLKNQIEIADLLQPVETPLPVSHDPFAAAKSLFDEVLPLVEQRILDKLDNFSPDIRQHPDYLHVQSLLETRSEELRQRDSELRELRQLYQSVLADRVEKTRTGLLLKGRISKLKQALAEKERLLNDQQMVDVIDYEELLDWNLRLQEEAELDDMQAAVEVDWVLDKARAKSRALALAQSDSKAGDISQQLTAERFRTIGKEGEPKPYAASTVGRWLSEWRKAGLL